MPRFALPRPARTASAIHAAALDRDARRTQTAEQFREPKRERDVWPVCRASIGSAPLAHGLRQAIWRIPRSVGLRLCSLNAIHAAILSCAVGLFHVGVSAETPASGISPQTIPRRANRDCSLLRVACASGLIQSQRVHIPGDVA